MLRTLVSILFTANFKRSVIALAAVLLLASAHSSLRAEPSTFEHRRISGVYPHLTVYGIYSQDGAHLKSGHNECGIGAIVPWANRLWMVNYAPHMPLGSEHKLFSIDQNLELTIHPESVGGTPAARMIHRESNQLLIGHHLVDAAGKVRSISPTAMPGRLTAIARHLKDPANMVYYIDMEGMIYEANVHTLAVKLLFRKPVPGWHGKGGYTAQGRLVVSNNGEHAAGTYKPLLVGGPAKNKDEAGVLAQWDGDEWTIVERRQFTDITGPDGIYGGQEKNSPLWAIGWDRRSLRLKLLEDGKWFTYLLPKATHNNDARHGWYTEWPRIREIGDSRMLMDMHGMFFDFPSTFSTVNTAGLRPLGSHLRYIPDFCNWNGQLILASDETSIQGNPLAGQPQTNLWFGKYDDLKQWGPASGFGGPWVADAVKANQPSDPFLIGGFDRRVLHLARGEATDMAAENRPLRASDQQVISKLPARLAHLPRVTVDRGDWHRAAPGYSFSVDKPVTVFLAVDQRGKPKLDGAWKSTDLTLTWGQSHQDIVYQREFAPGKIEIPTNDTEHIAGSFGMPHMAFVASAAEELKIEPERIAKLTRPPVAEQSVAGEAESVRFTLELDRDGNGKWEPYTKLDVSRRGYTQHVIPVEVSAQWVRLRADKDCVATAYFHLTDASLPAAESDQQLFGGLAGVDDEALPALMYPAKRNRNLRVITTGEAQFEFRKGSFDFQTSQSDAALVKKLHVEPEFTVDEASVILNTRSGRLRLPKETAAFDRPFTGGWPRGSREVESERHLANFHGTFYEIPLITNGAPPAFHLMRPVASHSKQITDFCSWNGLLVLSGVKADAAADEHVVRDPQNSVGLWFGGVDDLWKLGKPSGQGGPWKDAQVKANQPSDAYLMTGYDRKTLTLTVDRDVTITVEVDVDHQSGWHRYEEFDIKADQELEHEFDEAYSAHWIRFRTDNDCTATAWLKYE